MATMIFPDPRAANPDGLVTIGGDLHTDTLLAAYRVGIFPWPMENYPLVWFSPQQRGVLEFDRVRTPRSLAKERARTTFRFSIDRCFSSVIHACAQTPRGDDGITWITSEMVAAYIEFHKQGFAHSVEAWEGDELVGGLYGVEIDGAFAGESMFHRKSGASKLALLFLVDHLRERGLNWMDTQTASPLMSMLGGRTIPRDEFLEKLTVTRALGLRLFDR